MTKRIRITKKIKKFIAEKVSEGFTVADICDRIYKDEMPNSKSVYRAEAKDPEFHEEMSKAYELFFQRKVEELEYLSKTDSRELYPNMDDFRERAEARRIRIDTLKFELGKLAPMMTKRWQSSTKVEHSGKMEGPQIVIQSYSTLDVDQDNKEDEDQVH